MGTGNALENAQRTNIERGVITNGSERGYYPSFNATYRLTNNIQLRAGYAHSVNYPDLSQVAAVTNVSNFTSVPRRVTVNSPLGPWFGKNYDFDLEYYMKNGGALTLSFFRKEISDFIQQVRYPAGTPEAQATLARYGYDQLAGLGFEILEKFNGGGARFDGWEIDLRQPIDAYIPWARGLTVFGNYSYTATPRGVSANDIKASSQRLMNWGARYNRGKLGLNLKWNHVPEPKLRVPNTIHTISRTQLDIDVSYRIRPRATLFLSAANATSTPFGQYVYTSETPDYARRRNHYSFGFQGSVGIKGQF
jgi:TonB-dependent receptor